MDSERVEINHLIAKRLLGYELSSEEIERLDRWLSDPVRKRFYDSMANNKELLQKIEQYGYFHSVIDEAKQESHQYMTGNLRSVKNSFWNWRRYVVAASIFILLAIALFVVRFEKKDNTLPVVAQTEEKVEPIQPGRDGAILTLDGGTQIVLDTAANGTVTVQGSAQVTKQGSLLNYADAAPGKADVKFNTLTTPRGRQFQLALPDNSRIWLNASSSVTFPTAFVGLQRKIQITGEAYMEITKDAAHPFVVTVRGMDITVLGTSFNVNSYADEPALKTTLVEGRVTLQAAGRQLLLSPGQQGILEQDDFTLVKSADVDAALLWKNGMILLDKVDLPALMRVISRWYDVEVEVKPGIVAPEFIGRVPRSLSLEALIAALKMNSKLNFEIQGRKVIVSP